MLDKYFFACLVFTLIKNAVADISLDYYFGFEDTLRTARYMENCNSDGMQESCQERCGPNHACLLGKCFCVEVKPQIKKDEALIRQLKKDAAGSSPRHGGHQEDYDEESTSENNDGSFPLSVLQELLHRSKPEKKDQESSEEDSSSESESEESGRKSADLRRGFLGHGCHSLAKADECLRQCSVSGQQGFCDENQECNCGVYRNNFVGRNIKLSNMFTKSKAKYIKLQEMALRPTLRHHIAHFCPTLDIARECIHSCMMVRKPAFCGKDHVCYCGHRYGSLKDESKEYTSSEEKYGVFADLYTKYFGPRHKMRHFKTTTPAAITSSTVSSTTVAVTTEQTEESTTEETTTEETTTQELTTEETTTEAADDVTTEETTTEETTTEVTTTEETKTEEDQN